MHATRYYEYQSTSTSGYRAKILWDVIDGDKSATVSSGNIGFSFRFEKLLNDTCNVYCSAGVTHAEVNDHVPNRVILYWGGSANGLYTIGAFKIRKYVSPEPTISGYGAEETLQPFSEGMQAHHYLMTLHLNYLILTKNK
ncbi:MAG: hypothetical protein ACQXXJ_05835 [Candidatus Bathyarchaeia archaeon]|jgi:hypothetical protein